MTAARFALLWLEAHISDSVYLQTDKARNLAEAMGRYYLCMISADSNESVRAGDITVRTDSVKRMLVEEKLKNQVIASCGDILKDGDFYFGTC